MTLPPMAKSKGVHLNLLGLFCTFFTAHSSESILSA
jgi:hypothetical protein